MLALLARMTLFEEDKKRSKIFGKKSYQKIFGKKSNIKVNEFGL